MTAGAYPSGAEAQPQWTVLICLDTRGGLTEAADGYQHRMAVVCRRLGVPLAVLRLADEEDHPGRVTSRLLMLDKQGWREGGRRASGGAAEGIARAARTAFRVRPARYTMLVIVKHGGGVLEAYEGLGLDTGELARALAIGVQEWGGPVDVLGLDMCFSGALEKLWDLRQCARYISAAPGLVYSPGLRWDEALSRRGREGPREVAAEAARLGMTGGSRDAALVSLETSSLTAVVAELRGVAVQWRAQMARHGQGVTVARSQAHTWGRRQELCDLGDLAAGLARHAPDDSLRADAVRLQEAVKSSIVGRWSGVSPTADSLSGLGIYFPRTVEAVPPAYERLMFAADSDWYGFLRAYWEWVAARVTGEAYSG